MHYSLDQLQTFELVSQLGSFSAAARKMKKTQSSVSTAIGNLEIDLGVTLFIRTPRSVELTPAGEKILEHVHIILERCHLMDQHSASMNKGIEQQISLAIDIPCAVLSPVLQAFATQFPFVDVCIKEPFLGDIEAMLCQGNADLGIAFSKPISAGKCQFVQLGKLVMVHVVSRYHPLASKIPVSFTELHGWRHIAFSSHEKRIPTTEYLSTPALWLAESYAAILEATLAGLGWASLPKQFIQRELAEGALVELIQEEYPYTDWIVGVDLLWSRQHPQGPAVQWLKTKLIENKIFEFDSGGHMTTL